jgi:NAD(P)-dependent dehydrogenase (short-subunit alcohol dehydrogenase family)
MATWFITGCSTGFGRELAKATLAKGWNTVITARNPAAVADIAKGHEDISLVLPLDVMNKQQITDAVKAAEARFGSIDVLVNNAGYGYRAAVEEGDDAEVRRLFDVNVFGLIDVTKAALPGMRKQRKGHIINVSSVAGRVALPGVAYYAASKFAVNGLSDGLAKEVAPFGIKVSIIEPGPARTDFRSRSMRDATQTIDDYSQSAAGKQTASSKAVQGAGGQGGDPVRVAAAIIKVAEMDSPPLHLLLGAVTLERVSKELTARQRELEEWQETTKSADFPS